MRKKKNDVGADYKMVFAPLHGEVAASANVVPFVARNQMIPVAVPSSEKDSDIGCLIVSGPSLSELGINDGDILIFTKRFSQREVMFDSICIVMILSTQELVAKKIVFEGKGLIRLKASGGGVQDMVLPIEDIEIRGKVLSYQVKCK